MDSGHTEMQLLLSATSEEMSLEIRHATVLSALDALRGCIHAHLSSLADVDKGQGSRDGCALHAGYRLQMDYCGLCNSLQLYRRSASRAIRLIGWSRLC
jgi:hypothetical protein